MFCRYWIFFTNYGRIFIALKCYSLRFKKNRLHFIIIVWIKFGFMSTRKIDHCKKKPEINIDLCSESSFWMQLFIFSFGLRKMMDCWSYHPYGPSKKCTLKCGFFGSEQSDEAIVYIYFFIQKMVYNNDKIVVIKLTRFVVFKL